MPGSDTLVDDLSYENAALKEQIKRMERAQPMTGAYKHYRIVISDKSHPLHNQKVQFHSQHTPAAGEFLFFAFEGKDYRLRIKEVCYFGTHFALEGKFSNITFNPEAILACVIDSRDTNKEHGL